MIEGYKKIDLEEYKIIEKSYHKGEEYQFGSFPSDGIWIVETKPSSKSSSRVIDIKKFKELPKEFPLIEMALRESDIARAILKFVESKNKSLLDIGSCSYSTSELSEFIIKYLLSKEYGSGNRKFLLEKKWIKIEGNEHNRICNF